MLEKTVFRRRQAKIPSLEGRQKSGALLRARSSTLDWPFKVGMTGPMRTCMLAGRLIRREK